MVQKKKITFISRSTSIILGPMDQPEGAWLMLPIGSSVRIGGWEWRRRKKKPWQKQHGRYFSLTRLCVHTWFQSGPSPEEASQHIVCQFFKTVTSIFGPISFRRMKTLLGTLLSLCRCEQVRKCHPFAPRNASFPDQQYIRRQCRHMYLTAYEKSHYTWRFIPYKPSK